MKKILPLLATLTLGLSACSGPSPDDLRSSDPEGSAACIHFGGSLDTAGEIGATNRQKAAAHGAAASTAAIREAVSTDGSGQPQIIDTEAFAKACEQQGFGFSK